MTVKGTPRHELEASIARLPPGVTRQTCEQALAQYPTLNPVASAFAELREGLRALHAELMRQSHTADSLHSTTDNQLEVVYELGRSMAYADAARRLAQTADLAE